MPLNPQQQEEAIEELVRGARLTAPMSRLEAESYVRPMAELAPA